MRIAAIVAVFLALFTLLPAQSRAEEPSVPPPPPLLTIQGTLVDAATGAPISAGQAPFGQLWLWRIVNGVRQFVAATDCVPGGGPVNGCPDAQGRWTFWRDFSGAPLPAGEYTLEAWAWWHYLQRVAVNGTGLWNVNVGTIRLQPQVVEIRITGFPSRIPANGGTVSWSWRLTNLSNWFLPLEVRATFSGPGLITPFSTLIPAKMNVDLSPRADMEFPAPNVFVPAGLPGGAYYCLSVQVALRDWPLPQGPWLVATEAGLCALKEP